MSDSLPVDKFNVLKNCYKSLQDVTQNVARRHTKAYYFTHRAVVEQLGWNQRLRVARRDEAAQLDVDRHESGARDCALHHVLHDAQERQLRLHGGRRRQLNHHHVSVARDRHDQLSLPAML